MNFGFRYHLASLMAVFCSLILGILIGGSLFPDNALVEEQGQFIAELEERFVLMQADSTILKTQLNFFENAWEQLRDSIAEDRLEGKTVVVVGDEDFATGVRKMLHSTGAQIKVIGTELVSLVSPSDELVFLAELTENDLSRNFLQAIKDSVEQGAHWTFVWENETNPSLQGLPASLQVDAVDTIIGEIALILGLSSNSKGRYGSQANSGRLFPL